MAAVVLGVVAVIGVAVGLDVVMGAVTSSPMPHICSNGTEITWTMDL